MSTSFKDLRGKYNAVATELSALAQQETRSADEESKLDQLLAEFNDLGPQVERAASVENAAAKADSMKQSRGVAANVLPVEGAEDHQEARHESMGAKFAQSEELHSWRERGGTRSNPVEVGSFYHRDAAGAIHADGSGPVDRRALVYSGSMPNSYVQPTYVPGFFRGEDLQGTLRSVLFNGQTSSDAITFYRELSVTNGAAPVAEATAATGSTGLKPESGITFEEATAPVKTIATHMPVTRQLLWDTPAMQTYIEGRLLDFLRLEESDQILNGDGTGANFTGLLNTSGVQALDAAAFTAAPVNGVGNDNENFDRILRAKTLIRSVGRARANFAVVNPADLEGFLTATNANNNYYGAGPFSDSLGNLWGLRIVEDENIAEGTVLVGDGRMAGIWDRMQAQILIDTINDQFIRNMLTILAEERLALTVFRPAAFAEVALA